MLVEEVAAGEVRRWTGPIYGARLLTARPGASLTVDGRTLPPGMLAGVQASLLRPIWRAEATGPATVQIAETPAESSGKAQASPRPPVNLPYAQAIVVPGWALPPGTVLGTFTRPRGATSFLGLWTGANLMPACRWRAGFHVGGFFEFTHGGSSAVGPALMAEFGPECPAARNFAGAVLTACACDAAAPDVLTVSINAVTAVGKSGTINGRWW